MKKSLLLVLFAALTWCWTAKADQVTFDFTDGQIPAGWSNDETYPWVSAPTDPDGVAGAYIKSSNNGVGNSSSALSATFTFIGDGSITFRGGCWGEGTSTAWDKCIFMIDGVQKFAYGALQTWDTYSYDLEAGEHTFTWKYTKDSSVDKPGDAFFLDNVVVDLGSATALAKPTNLACDSKTSATATLSWTEAGTATAWEIMLNNDENNIIAAATNPFTVSGLTAATSYSAKVRATDGTNVSAWSGAVNFFTDCDAYSIPYSYGFEDAAMFTCWDAVSGVSIETTHANTGGKNLKFAGANPFVILPNFQDPLNTLRLEIWARPESTTSNSGKLQVGYVTNPSDTTTFVAVATYVYTDWASAAYVKKSIDFNNAPAGATMAMRQVDHSSSWYWFVDDVTVKAIPNCLAPSGLAASDATSSSATLSWTANSGESEWRIYYKKTSSPAYIEVNNITTNSFTLTGLDASTIYQAYVVAKCSASEVSEESEIITFNTECAPFNQYPWVDSLDAYVGATSGTVNNLPICWSYVNKCSYNSYKGYPIIYSSASSAHSGSNSLRLYSYFSSYSDYDPQPQYAILPEMSGLDDKQLSVWIKGYNTSSTVKVGRMEDPTNVGTFHLIAEQTLTTSYAEYTFNLSAATGNYIVFMIDAAATGRTTNGVYIDDISVHEAPACSKPSAPEVDDITARSASISWTPGADETAWQIMVNNDADHLIAATTNPYVLTGLTPETRYVVKVRSNCGDSQSEWANDSVVFTTTVACPAPVFDADSIQDILATSAKLVWGGDAESFIVSYRKAASVDGIFEGFEDAATYSQWTGSNLNSGSAVDVNAAHSGNYGFAFHWSTNPPQYLISPAITGLAAGATLQFYYKAYSATYAESFQVGYSSTDNAVESFTFGDEITTPDIQWHLFSEVVPTGTMYVCIKCTSNDRYYLFVDDIQLGEEIPAGQWVVDNNVQGNSKQLTGLDPETKYDVFIQANCGTDGFSSTTDTLSFYTVSSCQTPADLEASAIGLDSAVISWNGYGLSGFNLRYASEGENWNVISGATNPQVISNLASGTTYKVQVQATCNTEVWSDTLFFKTVYSVPFSNDMENLDGWRTYKKAASAVFNGESLSGSGYWTLAAANDVYAEEQFVLNIYGSSCNDWLVTPEIDLTGVTIPQGSILKLTFKAALAKWNSDHDLNTPADTTGTDDIFMVAVSLNAGQTWDSINATVWSNTGSFPEFNQISRDGMPIWLDFSAYVGNKIKIAFYGQSTVSNADNDLHIGEILLDIVGEGTGIENIEATDKAIKFFRDGNIYIRFNGATYDIVGRKVE